MPFAAIVLLCFRIPISTCYYSRLGAPLSGLRPTLKYLVLQVEYSLHHVLAS